MIDPDGVQRYGGDFEGELTHDGNFCCDGMVFADRSLKAGSLEVKAAYQPIRTTYRDGVLFITNRYDFTNLSACTLEYSVECDGRTVEAKTLPIQAEPHETVGIPLPLPPYKAVYGLYLNCRLYKDGKLKAQTQHPLKFETIPRREEELPAEQTEDRENYYLSGEGFSYTFSKHYGCFTSLDIRGTEHLCAPIRLSVWRAPVDNDRNIRTLWGNETIWQGENFNRLMHHGSSVGRYTSSAQKEYVPYVVPQEHGNHTQVRELTIGRLRIESQDGLECSVSQYTAEMLTAAAHTDELIPDGYTHLRIDYRLSGLGSNSCGPELPDPFRVSEKEIHVAFSISPCTENER